MLKLKNLLPQQFWHKMVKKNQVPRARILRRARSPSASLARGRSASKTTGRNAVSNESNRAGKSSRVRVLKPQAKRETAPIRLKGARTRSGTLGRERRDRWKPSNVHTTLGQLAEVSPTTLDQIAM